MVQYKSKQFTARWSIQNKQAKLIDAIISNNASHVIKLLERGAGPNHYEDDSLVTPLHYAVLYNANLCIYPLINAGADPLQLNQDKQSSLQLAKIQANPVCYQLLLQCLTISSHNSNHSFKAYASH